MDSRSERRGSAQFRVGLMGVAIASLASCSLILDFEKKDLAADDAGLPDAEVVDIDAEFIVDAAPLSVQEDYVDMLRHIGLDPLEHDIRFVEDDWESPTLGAWGLGWEVWADGMEITQFTYFQQAGGIELMPVTAELTIGLERIAMYLQNVDNIFDLQWNKDIKYGDVHMQSEVEYSHFNFHHADTALNFELFDKFEAECKRLVEAKVVLPAYDYCMKASHVFNLLDARGAISVTERQRYIGRVRALARVCAEGYVLSRAELGFPLLGKEKGAKAKAAFDEHLERGVNAAARAAARAVYQEMSNAA